MKVCESLIVLGVFAVTAVADNALATPDAHEVAWSIVNNRGGPAKIRALNSYEMRGTISSEYGSATLRTIWKRPNQLRIEIGDSSDMLVMATDGHTYWKLELGPWHPEPEAMLAYERDVFSRQADFDSPFIDIQYDDPSSWDGMELLWQSPAIATVPDTSTALTYLLSYTDTDSNRTLYRFDRSSGLITWEAFYADRHRLSVPVEISYASYKAAGGINFPHRIERFVNGESYDAVTIDTVVVDGDYQNSLFRMPTNLVTHTSAAVPRLASVVPLRNALRADSGMVRLIALLSPTLGACRRGYLDVMAVLDSVQSDSLRVYVVWEAMLASDDSAAAVRRASEVNDPRLVHFWDPEKLTGSTWRHVLGLSGPPPWAVNFVYGTETDWSGLPPRPDFWQHQGVGTDVAPALNCAELVSGVRRLMQ